LPKKKKKSMTSPHLTCRGRTALPTPPPPRRSYGVAKTELAYGEVKFIGT
jgi:hypothetical protein